MTETWRIIEGDCIDVLASLDQSPRLIFADPPYNIGVDYGAGSRADRRPAGEYLAWCRRWIGACVEALLPDGSMWVLISDEWADHFGVMLTEAGMIRRSWIKWYESFGVNCASKFNRTSRHLFYVVKHARRFTFNRQAVSRPSARQAKYRDKRANPNGKILDDVWTDIPRLCGTHRERIDGFPTQLPVALLRRIVACSSDPGDLVLDPFSGSATTGAASILLGRRYLGIEQNAEFAARSRDRLRAVMSQWSEPSDR